MTTQTPGLRQYLVCVRPRLITFRAYIAGIPSGKVPCYWLVIRV